MLAAKFVPVLTSMTMRGFYISFFHSARFLLSLQISLAPELRSFCPMMVERQKKKKPTWPLNRKFEFFFDVFERCFYQFSFCPLFCHVVTIPLIVIFETVVSVGTTLRCCSRRILLNLMSVAK